MRNLGLWFFDFVTQLKAYWGKEDSNVTLFMIYRL